MILRVQGSKDIHADRIYPTQTAGGNPRQFWDAFKKAFYAFDSGRLEVYS